MGRTMDANRTNAGNDEQEIEAPSNRVSIAEVAVEAIVGAFAGAATGVLAGPPGIVAGAVIGGAVGAAAGVAAHDGRLDHEAKDAEADQDIGVIGGDLGAARPDAPRARRGTFSAASLGLGGRAEAAPSEGPIQSLDDE